MHIRTCRTLTLVAAMALAMLTVIACSENPQDVVVRASGTGFTIVGMLGEETRFVLFNDGSDLHEAQVLDLNGHAPSELKDALAQGTMPGWVTVAAKAGPAEAGTIATVVAKTPNTWSSISSTQTPAHSRSFAARGRIRRLPTRPVPDSQSQTARRHRLTQPAVSEGLFQEHLQRVTEMSFVPTNPDGCLGARKRALRSRGHE